MPVGAEELFGEYVLYIHHGGKVVLPMTVHDPMALADKQGSMLSSTTPARRTTGVTGTSSYKQRRRLAWPVIDLAAYGLC